MKIMFAGLLLFLASAITDIGYSRYIGPNLVREFRTGFTLPEYTRSELAHQIRSDKIGRAHV